MAYFLAGMVDLLGYLKLTTTLSSEVEFASWYLIYSLMIALQAVNLFQSKEKFKVITDLSVAVLGVISLFGVFVGFQGASFMGCLHICDGSRIVLSAPKMSLMPYSEVDITPAINFFGCLGAFVQFSLCGVCFINSDRVKNKDS